MTLTDSIPHGLSDNELQLMLTHMIRARRHSQRFFALQRQGRVGTNAPIDGQEAVVVGSVAALNPLTDWVVPQYREQVAFARYGDVVLEKQCLYLRGHPAGSSYPADVLVFPQQISLATQIPHALGLAWGMALRGESGVAAVYFGDGASSEGDFYEAANFAGVLKAPVIFILTNNQWAISTPRHKQTAATSYADKANAFGFPGVQVDGNDVIAMWEVTAAARQRAARGDGPTLIEAITFRMGYHTTADDPSRYMLPEQRQEWVDKDPIVRYRSQLEGLGLWDEAAEEAAVSSADDVFDRAFAAAEATPLPPEALFDHVFAEPSARLVQQRASFLADRAARAERNDRGGR